MQRLVNLLLLLNVASLAALAGPIVCGVAHPNFPHPTPPDDLNCAQTQPDPATDAPVGIVSMLMQNNTTFTQANGWNFLAGGRDLSKDLTVDPYYAWVVNSPDVPAPDGSMLNVNRMNMDVGGAVFVMTYTPKAGDPPAANIHFLQIYSQSLDGGPVTYHVDNDGLANTPFYDQVPGTPVQRPPDGTAWFEDQPFECENNVTCALEGKEDHFAEFQFGVYLTVDNFDAVNNVHRVSVYAGKQWGYSYGTLDLPEPAGIVLTGAGLLVVLMLKQNRKTHIGRG